MKRIIIIPVIVGLLFFSCNKEKSRTGGEVPGETDAVLSAADAGSGGWNEGYILRVNASLMVLETDTGSESDKTKWQASMALGERVSVGGVRRATYDGRAYDFPVVRRDDGREGLAFPSQIAEGGRLAVVVDEKANLFRTPKTLDVTGNVLPRKTVAVLFPETERDGFVEIKAYDPTLGGIRNYVRTGALSERDADIQSAILLLTAETFKNEGSEKIRRDVLLDSALTDYPNSVFIADIIALSAPNTAAAIETEPAETVSMFIIDTNVNVRDIPDTVAGKVVGRLNTGEEVTINLQTVNTTTIDGYSARWYHITRPIIGWVFGRYLGFVN
jgi:hypothetical protein